MCMVGQTQGGTMAQIGAAMARKNGDEKNAQGFDAVAARQRTSQSAPAGSSSGAPQLATAKTASRPNTVLGAVAMPGGGGKTLLGQ